MIVDALKEKKATKKFGNGRMTRQEAREAARLHIEGRGLIDHVLKSMNNVLVDCSSCSEQIHSGTRVFDSRAQE